MAEYMYAVVYQPMPTYPTFNRRRRQSTATGSANQANRATAELQYSRSSFRRPRTASSSYVESRTSEPTPPVPSSPAVRKVLDGDVDHFPTAREHDSRSVPAAGAAPHLQTPRGTPLPKGQQKPDLRHVAMYNELEASNYKSSTAARQMNASFTRAESNSSTSVATVPSTQTSDPSASLDATTKPFVQRNGRTYYNDSSLAYPLPSDLTELHRQSLRTLLLIQVYGAPVCCPQLLTKPPQRVLEIGCGTGFWSMMCHRYYKSRGHGGIEFVGVDIAPLAPGSANLRADSIKPDRDMKWKFIQHDLRQRPWPFDEGEFDLVMTKDMCLATINVDQQTHIDESLRILKPGGVYEHWETDHLVRMLRPHVPSSSVSGSDTEEQEAASSLGAYVMNANTPLSAPLNTYLVEYNHWLSRALEARGVVANPCALMGAALLQESETLADVRSRRLAIPYSEVRWEREGVGGVVTKDGKSYVEMKGRNPPHQKVEKKSLTPGQAALRRTALLTLVQEIQAMEPLLREISGKSQDELDMWLGKMTTDLMGESGTSWGECLEAGAWWATRK